MADPTNQLAYELLGCSLIHLSRSWWAVKLDNDSWICEAHWKRDLTTGRERLTDWTFDLVENDLTPRIKEVWLFCPPGRVSPVGNTARMPIVIPGTALQFKISYFDTNIALAARTPCAHIIGRVDDPATGESTVFAWDYYQQALLTPKKTTTQELEDLQRRGMGHAIWTGNVHQGLGTWRPGSIAGISPLAKDVLGLKV